MEVLAVELMAMKFVAAMKLVPAVKLMTAVKTATTMESPVPTTTSGQRGGGYRCHCQDRNCEDQLADHRSPLIVQFVFNSLDGLMGGSAPRPLSVLAIPSYLSRSCPNLAPRAVGTVGVVLTTVNARCGPPR
jgi:hypothetical protein